MYRLAEYGAVRGPVGTDALLLVPLCVGAVGLPSALILLCPDFVRCVCTSVFGGLRATPPMQRLLHFFKSSREAYKGLTRYRLWQVVAWCYVPSDRQ